MAYGSESWETILHLMRGGKVGIGTTTPTSSLDINGTLTNPLAGTVDVASGTAAVVGTGTSFTTQLNVGDAIKIEVFKKSKVGTFF